MKHLSWLAFGVVLLLASCKTVDSTDRSQGVDSTNDRQQMELGNFSVSLAVRDIKASRAFYENLGFTAFGGDITQNWLIMKSGEVNIGLFQGMFEDNIMTFNPGWSNSAEHLDEFTDIRVIQARLKDSGLVLITEADETTTGPASFMLADPDGNIILVDQHR